MINNKYVCAHCDCMFPNFNIQIKTEEYDMINTIHIAVGLTAQKALGKISWD